MNVVSLSTKSIFLIFTLMKIKFFAFVALASLACSSCVDVPEAKFTPYETMIVKRSSQDLPTVVSANISGVNTVNIFPRISGNLVEKCVSNGQRVRKGQVLFKIDDQAQQQRLQVAISSRISAENELANAKLNFESNRDLFNKNIVSRHVLESSENVYKGALAALKVAQSQEELARTELSYCSISAPADGVIGEIYSSVGDLVGPSMSQPITILSDDRVMNASFSVNENDLIYLVNQFGSLSKVLDAAPEVDLTLKDGSLYNHKGHVVSLSGIVDRSTGSVLCKAEFPNPEGRLFSGQHGNVVFNYHYDDVIVIPMSATVTLQDKVLVYKVGPDSCAVATVITVSPQNTGNDYIVTSGLEPGDEIVAVGAVSVQDKMKVK